MNMRDEIIDLRGSTVSQRRELGTLLIDLGEVLFDPKNLILSSYPAYLFNDGDWSGYGNATPTIGLQSFITKYSAQLTAENAPTEDTSASIKLTTRMVIGDSKERFEKAVNVLEAEGYNILPETFLVNNTRYTILMKLTKPKETPCLQL